MDFLGFDLGQFDFQGWLDSAWAFAGPRLIVSIGQLLLVFVVWLTARWILKRIEHVQLIRRVVLISIVFWGGWRLTQIWELGHLSRTIGAVWIVMLSLPISAFVSSALRVVEERVAPKTDSRLDDTALPLLNRIVRGLVVGLGILIALTFLGINITPILAGAGVMGLGVSLAAKDTLSNLIAGLLLIIDRPFQVGDRIELWNAPTETGSWGDVIEIGLRATKIRNPDNLIIVVPNNEIMRRDIINYTASGPHIRLRIPIGIAYNADAEKAKALIIEVAKSTDGVKPTPEPVVITRKFGESSIDLELRVWIREARDRRAIGDAIGDRVKKKFDEHGIEIPFPRRARLPSDYPN
jgi:MscS family membrane protein